MMRLVSRFFAFNRRLSFALEERLPAGFRHHLHTLYKYQVADLLNRRPHQIVIDVGGGKECPFLPFVDDPGGHVLVALDIAEGELRQNTRVDLRVVADATLSGLPLRDGSADLVVSRSLAEHLRDTRAYFANCARALRPGGTMVHAFPCRFAPFALVNRVLPTPLVRRLIAYLLPEWAAEGNYGFVAYYDQCYYSAIKDLLRANGLTNDRFVFTYYQSMYFTPFFPLFCVMVSYDLLLWALGIRNLASGMLVIAERPAVDAVLPLRPAAPAESPAATELAR
jgi:SAM-dependent methyltransferase